jgi:two-component system response regulator HydG
VLGHIRQQYPDTPVIMISGMGDQELAQGLIRLGAFDFILKPFSLEVVEKSVKRAVEYRRRLSEASPEESDSTGHNKNESDEWKIVGKKPL